MVLVDSLDWAEAAVGTSWVLRQCALCGYESGADFFWECADCEKGWYLCDWVYNPNSGTRSCYEPVGADKGLRAICGCTHTSLLQASNV